MWPNSAPSSYLMKYTKKKEMHCLMVTCINNKLNDWLKTDLELSSFNPLSHITYFNNTHGYSYKLEHN